MSYSIQQALTSVALGLLASGCMAQQTQSMAPQLAQERHALDAKKLQERQNDVCMGEACGPATLRTAWMLGDPKTLRNEDFALPIGACHGTVCGPMIDVSTWLLAEPPAGMQCLGTACGPVMPPSSWAIDYGESARSQLEPQLKL